MIGNGAVADLAGSTGSILDTSKDKDPIRVEVVNLETNNKNLKEHPLAFKKQKSSNK